MNRQMKLVVGFHDLEGFLQLAEAGADECFCGYIPQEWYRTYGTAFPLNRREVRYYPVQIPSLTDMALLGRLSQDVQVPISVTFNALCYQQGQYPLLERTIRQLMELGFSRFIVADPGLVCYLAQRQVDCQLHLSGECGQVNRLSVKLFHGMGVARQIFPRQVSIDDMASCIGNAALPMEYEAFLLNEKCHFTGAYCNSLHCDELPPICQVPYQLGALHPGVDLSPLSPPSPSCDCQGVPGESGCGLCALPALRAAGITHLKLVGRGCPTDEMVRDVHLVRAALRLLEDCPAEQYRDACKELLGGGCSGNCYYPAQSRPSTSSRQMEK